MAASYLEHISPWGYGWWGYGGYYGWGWGGYYGYGWDSYYDWGWDSYYGYGGGGYYGYGASGYVYGNYYDGFGWYGGSWNAAAYGWYGWGLGYGWGWGYGWGGWYNGNSDAWAALQDSLQTARESHVTSATAEELTYVAAIGDAQIDRAGQLGDAQVALATARATAGNNYASALNTAETTYTGAIAVAKGVYGISVANANKALAEGTAAAERARIFAEEDAGVVLCNLEGTAAVVHAGALAAAEATYQRNSSDSQAQILLSLAAGSGSPQLAYQAAYAWAKSEWIEDVSPAHVAQAISRATARGQLTYDIALARGIRNVARAQADETFAKAVAAEDRTYAIDAMVPTNTHEAALVGWDNARRLAAAQHAGVYEVAVAEAEKQLAVGHAEAEKQLHIERVNEVDSQERGRNKEKAVADAVLAQATALAGARRDWQNAETLARRNYTMGEANAQKTYAQSLAALQYTHAAQVALAEEARQHTRAGAEGNFWLAEAAARNAQRTGLAVADATLWTAQENARVDAHGVIDALLDLPWTDYLVAAAGTRRDWWTSVAAGYLSLAADRNLAEATYAGRLATAYVLREQDIATAEKNHALAAADVQYHTTRDRAQAIRDYFFALAEPAGSNAAQTYGAAVAQAQYQHDVSAAQARRAYAYHQDAGLRATQLQTAASNLQQDKRNAALYWFSAESLAQADKFLDFATIDRDASLALIAADVALANAKTHAEKLYRNEETSAYVQSATAWANIDAVYRQYEAVTFAAAAAQLATSHPSPWAAYEAADYAARAQRTTTATNAARTRTIDQATAQAAAETSQTNTDARWRTAYAIDSGLYREALVGLDWARADLQATAIIALGASGIYRTELPALDAPADLAGQYAVSSASSARYLVTITQSYSAPSWYVYSWYWGGWGHYDVGYWWHHSPWTAISWVRSPHSVNLIEPAEQLPPSFWDVAGEADGIEDTSAPADRYGGMGRLQLVAGRTPEVLSRILVVSPVTEISDGTASDHSEVTSLLQWLDPEAGELWSAHGANRLAELPARPAIAVVADSPVLASDASVRADASELPSSGVHPTELPASTRSMSMRVAPTHTSAELAARLAAQASDASDTDADAGSLLPSTALANPPGRTASQKLSAIERVGHYLRGLESQDNAKFLDQAFEIGANILRAEANRFQHPVDYGSGFVKGFFVDGLWGNVEGLGAIVKAGWAAQKYMWYINPLTRWIGQKAGYDFDSERQLERNVQNAVQLIFKVFSAVGTELGQQAAEHYRVLSEGTPEELQALGRQHQVTAAFMSLAVLLTRELEELSPATRGRIEGAITWEVAQTTAEILLTAGAATVATKGAKLVRIADKLHDFAKTADRLGDTAGPVLRKLAELTQEGGELRRLLRKFDAAADLGSTAKSLLRGDVPVDRKRLSDLIDVGTPIELGTPRSRRILFEHNKKDPFGLSLDRVDEPAYAVFRVDEQGSAAGPQPSGGPVASASGQWQWRVERHEDTTARGR